ncbi:MAG: bifunctional precorrin-2 dehydrogenase/sirohydrochlorin ferrochelatase [Dysgonamonadaceae bacterium]|jgi:siroheme synthase-like protein|nr:bifunctional precorrin-2 dehydrogenase/sirohydrochlorin ferrochelatase [Dysgonamonadaceae bacterium]
MGKIVLNFLPISVNITGKKILIIGGGKVGFHKAVIINRFTDEITVVSPQFYERFYELPVTTITKEYESSDLDGFFLVYICTENNELNLRIKRDAEAKGILANVCDNPSLCDFISPAIYKNGNMTVAVSSNADDVRRSIKVRDEIAGLVADEKLNI